MTSQPSKEISSRQLVYFAAERTLMSWIRTALGLMGLGFVVDRFALFLRHTMPKGYLEASSGALSLWTGSSLVMLGVLMTLVAAFRYYAFARRYHRQNEKAESQLGLPMGILFSLGVAALGGVIIMVLFTVTGTAD